MGVDHLRKLGFAYGKEPDLGCVLNPVRLAGLRAAHREACRVVQRNSRADAAEQVVANRCAVARPGDQQAHAGVEERVAMNLGVLDAVEPQSRATEVAERQIGDSAP